MNEFRFAEPGWIHLTWLVLVVAGLLAFCEFRGRSVLERFVSRVLQLRLAHRPPLGFRIASLVFVTVAMLLLVVALMRPQWGMRVQKSRKLNAQIMICLDVSRSMLAEDVAPNRLERAKIELDSLLGLLDEGQQVGLIAFAGKATVLCPMTPDFGFLRLILRETEPSSVGLGGTQIGDAIRKAVDGFRDAGDIHRMILLVTDGEDHDSYPLNAAKAAKEKGVKIVSIGFGDEAGSKIEVTDPVTGATSYIQDRNGQDVVSRLDGETLREIALQTDGAYIPAGTGALDLEAIYRAHIESLLRGTTDATERTVRNEAFQWPVLLSLAFLLAGLLVVTPIQRPVHGGLHAKNGQPSVSGTVTAATLLLLCVVTDSVSGQVPGPPPTPATRPNPSAAATTAKVPPTPSKSATDNDADAVAMPPTADTTVSEDLPPRATYNQAVAVLRSDLDKAESLLNAARSDAGSDGELRYRSLYNLGWLEVARADAQLKADPEKAKNHLQQAVNRFREAVRVRPDADEARYNLEVASRRLLELTDSLAKRDPGDVAKRLDELIEQLRAHQAELQAAVQQTGEEVDKSLAETYRQQFRQLGVTQRQVIADLQQLADDARKELDALQKKPADKQSPEERLKAGQLNNMLHFVDSCLQRLNQSRSLTRRLQGNRAFRRWSVGLSEAKRARDQLRNPLELIGLLIADANELLGATKSLATSSVSLTTDDKTEPAPIWLNREYLQDQQASMLERTKELNQVLSSAQPPESPSSPTTGGSEQTPSPDPRTKRLLDNIQTALPFLTKAVEHFSAASEEIASGSLDTVHTEQLAATVELTRAWELFLDVRRLIEVTYANTSMLRQVVGSDAGGEDARKQMATALREGNQTNIQRTARLKEMVEFELSQPAEGPPTAGNPVGPTATSPGAAGPGAAGTTATPSENPERQRYELAQKLLEPVAEHLANVDRELTAIVAAPPVDKPKDTEPEPEGATSAAESPTAPETPASAETPPTASDAPTANDAPAAETAPPTDTAPSHSEPGEPRWKTVETELDAALTSLEELRRLFFSIIEHLRETAQRQADLIDDTRQQSPLPPESQTADKIGPLAARQSQLQQFTQSLATALKEQSQQADQPTEGAQPTAAGADPGQAAAAKEAGKKLGKAAELVEEGDKAMGSAAAELNTLMEKFDAASKPYEKVTTQQAIALQKLLEALAILDQSPPDQQQQQQQDQQNQQDQKQDQQNQQEQSAQQQNLSANQLLQLIRDQEAQRREEKKQRQRSSATGVEKDW